MVNSTRPNFKKHIWSTRLSRAAQLPYSFFNGVIHKAANWCYSLVNIFQLLRCRSKDNKQMICLQPLIFSSSHREDSYTELETLSYSTPTPTLLNVFSNSFGRPPHWQKNMFIIFQIPHILWNKPLYKFGHSTFLLLVLPESAFRTLCFDFFTMIFPSFLLFRDPTKRTFRRTATGLRSWRCQHDQRRAGSHCRLSSSCYVMIETSRGLIRSWNGDYVLAGLGGLWRFDVL